MARTFEFVLYFVGCVIGDSVTKPDQSIIIRYAMLPIHGLLLADYYYYYYDYYYYYYYYYY